MDGLPSWARPGMPVVCIAESKRYVGPPSDDNYAVSVGEKATISRVNFQDGVWMTGLKERPPYCGYELSLFRPAVNDKTEAEDLAVFRPLLKPDRLDVLAESLDQQWVGMPSLDHVPEA